jgi:hypothetical protein
LAAVDEVFKDSTMIDFIRRAIFGSRDLGGGIKTCPRCRGNDKVSEGSEGGAFIHVRCTRCDIGYLG